MWGIWSQSNSSSPLLSKDKTAAKSKMANFMHCMIQIYSDDLGAVESSKSSMFGNVLLKEALQNDHQNCLKIQMK